MSSQATTKVMDPNAARKEARVVVTNSRAEALSAGEKVAFGVAAGFSTALLAITVMLTLIGFIFSPLTHTLVFALLAIATGATTYVIWRGGRKRAQ